MKTKAYLTNRSRSFYIAFLIIFTFIFVFFNLAEELVENELTAFDTSITNFILGFMNDAVTSFMKFITKLGAMGTIISLLPICAGLMLWQKKKWEAMALIAAVSGGAVFNLVLKFIFKRERPTLHRLIEEFGYSFPSGHSMMSMIFYGMVTYFLLLFLKNKTAKSVVLVAGITVVSLIGVSRIYLGVHYPSDVLSGFAAGGAWTMICILALHFIVQRRKMKSDYD
ncbi:phosphatase PAP2 family protein [Heliophilum fasciatum]|uniref:Undecaprenyl-diphosphatase n=1 Tax=Heliophilum fasciatum TaxID=35700 RepID=A0A4R2RLY1_9FIRM|nr:phosphatase PAP2 family protein [Heliophilum fasciatum]MCW2278205.1 undecaprenyl-diphosphatase [Heliophilum fasciatum]TCP63974.1 undecaprenyl-diphosphatase [Heliophilum fasciatum]